MASRAAISFLYHISMLLPFGGGIFVACLPRRAKGLAIRRISLPVFLALEGIVLGCGYWLWQEDKPILYLTKEAVVLRPGSLYLLGQGALILVFLAEALIHISDDDKGHGEAFPLVLLGCAGLVLSADNLWALLWSWGSLLLVSIVVRLLGIGSDDGALWDLWANVWSLVALFLAVFFVSPSTLSVSWGELSLEPRVAAILGLAGSLLFAFALRLNKVWQRPSSYLALLVSATCLLIRVGSALALVRPASSVALGGLSVVLVLVSIPCIVARLESALPHMALSNLFMIVFALLLEPSASRSIILLLVASWILALPILLLAGRTRQGSWQRLLGVIALGLLGGAPPVVGFAARWKLFQVAWRHHLGLVAGGLSFAYMLTLVPVVRQARYWLSKRPTQLPQSALAWGQLVFQATLAIGGVLGIFWAQLRPYPIAHFLVVTCAPLLGAVAFSHLFEVRLSSTVFGEQVSLYLAAGQAWLERLAIRTRVALNALCEGLESFSVGWTLIWIVTLLLLVR